MTRTADEVSDHLLQLGELIQTNITQLVESRRAVTATGNGTEPSDLPPWSVFNAQRALQAATGSLTELISQPENRLLEVSSQYFEARALHIAADARIPDLLAKTAPRGVPIDLLSAKAGIESRKLLEPDVFANNAVSAGLVDNEPLRAYILLFGLDLYTASDHLPRALHDSVKGSSYAVDQTAWQDALGVSKSRWDWLEENTSASDLHKGYNAAVQGTTDTDTAARTSPSAPGAGDQGGDAAAASPKTPYPGVFGTELSRVVGSGVGDGQPISRPEHAIFSLAMVGGGRVFGRAHLHAPQPLLPNWGYYTRYSHQRDLAMMAIINGIERKPDEFRELVERAGLRLRKIWDCRSQVGLVEVVLPNSEL
ncbi:hypothetical protein ACHAP6_005870 [Verticillium nonalfalfae]